MRKKWIAAVVAGTLMLGLSACSSEPETVVYVQNVGQIVGDGAIAMDNLYAGLVIPENVTEIQRDQSQKVEELFVTVGQDVTEGDTLFKYDAKELSLQLDKAKLALNQLKNHATTLNRQITQLKNEQKKADKDDQLSYTLEIQAREVELDENEYNIENKNEEIAQLQTALANVTVISPVTGRVVSVNEDGTDQYGNATAYITIQQSGTYRIKGAANEMNLATIAVGTAMRIVSRADESLVWTGTVTQVDTDGGSQNLDGDMLLGGTGTMTGTTKYTFYVEPEGAEGMLLGQHVYMEVDRGQEDRDGLWLPEYYVCYTDDGEPFVWADNGKERLERRAVELGGYDEAAMTFEILDGLTVEDYIAYPAPICEEGAGVTQDKSQVKAPAGQDETLSPVVPEDTGGVFNDDILGSDPQDDLQGLIGDLIGTEPSGDGVNETMGTGETVSGSVTGGDLGGDFGTSTNPDLVGG